MNEHKDNRWLGAIPATAGVVALMKSKPLVTGRETLYHGTTEEIKKKILKSGLKAVKDVPKSFTTMPVLNKYDVKVANKAKQYAYATPKVGLAKVYAHQSNIADGKYPTIKETLLNTANPFSRHGVVTLDVPTWQYNYRKQINPEAVLSGKNTSEILTASTNKSPAQIKRLATQTERGINKIAPALNPIPTKYIKGSKNFSPFYKELGQYIKAKPGRFAAGLGLATAGATGIAYGAEKLLHKDSIRKAASLISKDTLARKQQLCAAFGGPEEPNTRPVDQTTDTNNFELPTRTVEH